MGFTYLFFFLSYSSEKIANILYKVSSQRLKAVSVNPPTPLKKRGKISRPFPMPSRLNGNVQWSGNTQNLGNSFWLVSSPQKFPKKNV